ncbi:MAG: pantetheine-phosphate adenylyltransferase [Desulfovibrio sp.]|jgi:pantetheine-phosphate adenylyltransferase|nr:pantetheine-phosphate adenylyltransferase [Desulfovibrio sp.]
MQREAIVAVYPGTFDPLTNGHAGLVRRACAVFDTVVVAVAGDSPKNTLFSVEERVEMARTAFVDNPNVEVESFSGLTVDYADRRKAGVILRGLRAVSDFDYEFQITLMNRKMKRHINTVFLMADYQWLYISSTVVKASAKLGGDIRGLVPENVYYRLREKFGYPYPVDPDADPDAENDE